MARLAIVLPVVTPAVVQRDAAQDGHAVVHFLAIELMMDISARVEKLRREDKVLGLGLLEAEYVGLLLVEQALDDRDPGSNRVDVPGGDLERGHCRGRS